MLLLVFAALASEPEGVALTVPVVEVPDVYAELAGWPSLGGASQVAASVDRLAILGIQRGFEAAIPNNEGLRTGLGLAAAGSAGFGLIFVGAWAHEEAHRAVLRNRGISSRNGLYHPEAWSNGTISVDHVSDDDLAALKVGHPADTVRLMSAGMETQALIVRTIGDATFRDDEHGRTLGPLYLGQTWMYPAMLAEEMSVTLYRLRCVGEDSDVLTDAENRLRTVEADRDFTGLDCTAWVYDMRRPDAPYADRGEHPYGEGVDRYRSWEDLDADERGFLERQALLGLLDLLNPHLYGIDGFALPGEGARWIAQAGYMPTPWGYQFELRGGLRLPGLRLGAELHGGVAEAGLFPGVDVAWRDIPVGGRVALDVGVGGWLQPADLRWDASERAPGGRVWTDARVRLTPWLWLQPGVEAKSEGFVAGNVHLDPAVTGRLAVRVRVP